MMKRNILQQIHNKPECFCRKKSDYSIIILQATMGSLDCSVVVVNVDGPDHLLPLEVPDPEQEAELLLHPGSDVNRWSAEDILLLAAGILWAGRLLLVLLPGSSDWRHLSTIQK